MIDAHVLVVYWRRADGDSSANVFEYWQRACRRGEAQGFCQLLHPTWYHIHHALKTLLRRHIIATLQIAVLEQPRTAAVRATSCVREARCGLGVVSFASGALLPLVQEVFNSSSKYIVPRTWVEW